MRKTLALSILLFLSGAAAGADPVCPCLPIAFEWTVSPCETWNCASSALILANGDPYVITVPTNASKFPWVVVRRVVSGAVTVPDDAPFLIEKFDSITPATSRFSSVEAAHVPLMITTPDGKSLLIYLRNPDLRRPAVGR